MIGDTELRQLPKCAEPSSRTYAIFFTRCPIDCLHGLLPSDFVYKGFDWALRFKVVVILSIDSYSAAGLLLFVRCGNLNYQIGRPHRKH